MNFFRKRLHSVKKYANILEGKWEQKREKWKALGNTYYWKAIVFRNKLYACFYYLRAKMHKLREGIYWYFFQSKNFNRLRSIWANKSIYTRIFFEAVFQKMMGRKVITVFLLIPSHWMWVNHFLVTLSNSKKYFIQLICRTDLTPDVGKSLSCYSMDKISLTSQGVPLVPSVFTDLYLTPASTTAENAPSNTCKIMFMHSLTSIYGVYEADTFDGYDYIYCTGKHHVDEFREYYLKKGLTGKCLIPGGYPRLDDLVKKVDACEVTLPSRRIILAPTLVSAATEKVSMLPVARDIIASLLQDGWHVIFRPHPLNLTREDAFSTQFHTVIAEFKENASFEVDESNDYFETYQHSAIMISDISGTAYTYAFGFCKPVVFMEQGDGEVEFQKGLLYQSRDRIGQTVSSVTDLVVRVNVIFDKYADFSKKIFEFRNAILFNVGSSADYFVRNIDYVIKGKKHPEWVYI